MAKAVSPQAPAPPSRWGQERRLEFIDFRLLWDRSVNRGGLVEFFRISMQQASADIALYSQLAPQNIEYDRNLKTYRASTGFSPVYGRGDTKSFLNQLTALATGALSPSESFIGWRPPFDVVRFPQRSIPLTTLIRVIWAIRDDEDLKITYQSMRRPETTDRWIAPRALANDGLRWHVRAWCYESNEYRDFVISRIQDVHDVRKQSAALEEDTWWHTFVNIVIRPRAQLTDAQKKSIEIDFAMTDGRLVLSCRKALAFYILRHLRLDEKTDLPVIVQPIELENKKALQDVLLTASKVPETPSTN